MARSRKRPDTVVFARTPHAGARFAAAPATPLGPTEVRLKTANDGSATTGSRRPRPRVKPLAAFAGPLPPTYIGPAEKYILREEADKRYRILGTGPAGAVRPLHRPQVQAPSDNRVRITGTTVWPYSVHGHCVITFPDKKQYIGSGTMVNKHHVLTAGHVVYSKDNGGWATSVQFNAAQNDGTLPYAPAFATYLYSFTGWTESQLRDYDTGMLILDRDLGNSTGWLGLITTSDGNLLGHEISVAGYPGDKGGQQLWAATAPIASVADRQICYNAFTKGGDSGAGVYGIWQGINLEHVCADHVAGPNGTPNTGSRLARDKFDRIVNEWFSK
jgi:V8-like Glu-specific endopeptidase